MKRIFSLLICILIILTDFYVVPVYASVQDEADAQAKAFAGIWEQCGKKASDFEHTVLFEATGYQGDEPGGGGHFSQTGKPLELGMIAVDPSVIPMKSKVMICGHEFTAEDTGGAINKAIVDIWFPTIETCNNWGRQRVYVSWNGGSEPSPAGGSATSSPSVLEGDQSQFKMGNATGVTTDTTPTKKTEEKSITAQLAKIINSYKGTEDEIQGLDKVVKWGGIEVELPNGSDLTKTERSAIANWGADIANSERAFYINFARACMASAGLWFIVYTVLMYLVYWFDKVNNFIELSLLTILTFGKLAVSHDETISTFKSGNKGLKLVCHRDMCKVVVLGVTAGILILTGKLYIMISYFLEIIQKVTGGV